MILLISFSKECQLIVYVGSHLLLDLQIRGSSCPWPGSLFLDRFKTAGVVQVYLYIYLCICTEMSYHIYAASNSYSRM